MVEDEKHEKDNVYKDIHENLSKMVPKIKFTDTDRKRYC
jgi:hypothetical protein